MKKLTKSILFYVAILVIVYVIFKVWSLTITYF